MHRNDIVLAVVLCVTVLSVRTNDVGGTESRRFKPSLHVVYKGKASSSPVGCVVVVQWQSDFVDC